METKTAPDYRIIATGLAELLVEKQRAYGDSFSRSQSIIKVLYPNGIPPSKYQDALTIIRVIDKLFRIATNDDPFEEDAWIDIAGYGILSSAKRQMDKKEHLSMQKSIEP